MNCNSRKDVLKSYYDDAKWSGRGNDNCTDPAKLYESIVTKPEDIINYIRYYFFNRSKTYTAKVTSKSKKTWSYRYELYYSIHISLIK